MLVLSRKKGEGIYLGDNISVEIIAIEGDRVRIGIIAPKKVKIYRKELMDETILLNKIASKTPKLSLKLKL